MIYKATAYDSILFTITSFTKPNEFAVNCNSNGINIKVFEKCLIYLCFIITSFESRNMCSLLSGNS